MIRRAVGLALCLATPLEAQTVSSLSVAGPDLSDYATTASVSAAVVAAAPPACPVPAGDTLSGSAGTSAACMPRTDSARPTAVQAINAVLAADCTWSVIFGRPTVSAAPIVHASVVLPSGSTQPIPCSPLSRSTTGASGKCFPAQTTSLASVTVVGISVTAGSQVINPTASTCTAGMPVMVNVREPTQ